MRGRDELKAGGEEEGVDAFVRPHKIERTRRADIICISQHISVKPRLDRRSQFLLVIPTFKGFAILLLALINAEC